MIALGALCLLAAVLANGRPTVFSDTSDYFRVAHSAVRDASEAIFQGKPIISHEMWVDHFNNDEAADEEPIHNELGARSVYYGLFIYTMIPIAFVAVYVGMLVILPAKAQREIQQLLDELNMILDSSAAVAQTG